MNQYDSDILNGKDANLAMSHPRMAEFSAVDGLYRTLIEENELLRKEIQVARKAGGIHERYRHTL